ncbi:MAG: hypothetical protein RMK57_14345 [Bryobacterales bacterium]|nr:hypothetical protein [Bryobacterales bacterium]
MLRHVSIARLCLAAWVAVATAPAQSPAPLFGQIEGILSELAEITGLRLRKPVGYDSISRTRLRQFLEDRIREEIRPEEIRADELTLKKFGLLPWDFDLKKTMVDLLTEQAVALYDFRKKKLFVLESAPEMQQQMALVHELAHALADQHFDLKRFLEGARDDDDMAAARLAVMEGQASWLMSEYLARRTGQSLRTSPALLQLLSQTAAISAEQFPVFEAAPLYLRETLVFPYSKGMRFQHAVVEKKDKDGFAAVFRDPPVSTQQILHPEKYFTRAVPTRPELPRLAGEREYRELAAGTMGELDHWILLRQYDSEDVAASLAPRWRGGRYRLLEHKKNGRLVLLYASDWSEESAASEFFGRYRGLLARKWKQMTVTEEAEGRLTGRGDDGEFVLWLRGTVVRSAEGLASPADVRLAPAGELGYTGSN